MSLVLVRTAVDALPQAFAKLDPRHTFRSPVIFVVWVGSVFTTVLAVLDPSVFSVSITLWLWATVLFANLAEAVAEGRGRAQAQSLRQTRTDTTARRLLGEGSEEVVPGTDLRLGDLVVVEAGQVIPGDGDVVEGVATVDESAITGESAPVIRESGGDRCAVTGGTTVLSDRIVVKITSRPGETFIDRMIALVEGVARQKTPNEIALTILLTTLTLIFVLAVGAIQPMAVYSGQRLSLVVLVALLVCLIPTTIGALLSAIGIAGMDRLVQHNVLAMSGRAVEAAGDVSTLLLDKTARSPSATGRPVMSWRWAAPAGAICCGRPTSPPWPTRRPRGAPSSTTPSRAESTRRPGPSPSCAGPAPTSSPSRPPPGCPGSTCPTAPACARERVQQSPPGSRHPADASRTTSRRRWTASARAAAPPSSWRCRDPVNPPAPSA